MGRLAIAFPPVGKCGRNPDAGLKIPRNPREHPPAECPPRAAPGGAAAIRFVAHVLGVFPTEVCHLLNDKLPGVA